MADSISFRERLGFRRASGVGEAGWGRTLVVGDRQLHLFLAGAVDHPHRLQAADWRFSAANVFAASCSA